MRKILLIALAAALAAACGTTSQTAEVPTPTPEPPAPGSVSELATLAANTAEIDEVIVVTLPPPQDPFAQNGITLPAPLCSGATPAQMEGPYYKADTPERISFLEVNMTGTRLLLAGYVLDTDCRPLPNAWLDFWQADSNGDYDNQGYRLRGHQYTDAQGRYFLETVLPGLYSTRPIEHIHVKVKPEGGAEVTSQLYFPDQPVEGLTVTLEDRGGYFVGYFNFVVQR